MPENDMLIPDVEIARDLLEKIKQLDLETQRYIMLCIIANSNAQAIEEGSIETDEKSLEFLKNMQKIFETYTEVMQVVVDADHRIVKLQPNALNPSSRPPL